jgi:polar amino acid transport system substrate-binding protein
MKRILFFVIIILCLQVSLIQARDISMVTVDWEPYYASSLDKGGVYTEIIMTAFKRVGHKATIKFLPWKRALKYVAEGKNDIVMGAYYNKEREKTYFFSDSCMTLHSGLVAHKNLGITEYKSLKDLKPYKIGINRGWIYSPEFDSADYLQKDEATNQMVNIRKFFKRRVDMIAITIEIFQYEISRMKNHDMSEVVVLNPHLGEKGLHLMMGRKIPDYKKIIADFNRGLKEIRNDGTYGSILSSHGF